MWVSEEVWEECGRRRWDFLYVNFNWILPNFTTQFADLCLLSGIGRGTEAELGPDKPGFALQQHWWYRGSGLVFGEDGEHEGKGTGVRIETELVEGEMVSWVKGRICRGLVLRCAKSIMQIWVKFELVLFISLETTLTWYVSMSGSMRACGRRRWDFFYVNFNRNFHDFTTFCRSLSAVRLWQRDWSTTRPWQTWIWKPTTLAQKGLRLGIWWGCWGCWGIDHEGGRYCSRDPDRANRRWNGELSERKAIQIIQRIGAEMCQVHPSPSCREWIWACSFPFIADHMICEYQRTYEKNAVEGVEISCMWISIEFYLISPRSLQIFVCCQALAEGLKQNSALTNLNLGSNNIGDTGAQAWCLVRMVKMGVMYHSKDWDTAVRKWFFEGRRCRIDMSWCSDA